MRNLICLLFGLCAGFSAFPARAQGAGELLVFAASSLTDVMTEAGEAYAKTGKPKPVFSFAASSALARQIESGAPAGIFISADVDWMNYLAARQLIAGDSRSTFLGNQLVLITPADRPLKLAVTPGFALAAQLGGGKLALADPMGVPAGRYAKAALEYLGVWAAVEASVVRADNVRGALAFVERGEAAAGVVYATDARLTNKVTVVDTFPPGSHPPISYPLGIITAQDTPEARAFRDFLLGEQARAIYRRHGFSVR